MIVPSNSNQKQLHRRTSLKKLIQTRIKRKDINHNTYNRKTDSNILQHDISTIDIIQ